MDESTFRNLLKSSDNHWALFIGHIVVEKLLKALVVQKNKEGFVVPRSHDLLLLAEKANLEINEQRADILDLISTFNINARYPDYKRGFYQKCTDDYTKERALEIDEVIAWLKNLIQEP